MRTTEATFEPSKSKSGWKPIDDANIYPAHIAALNERTVTVRGAPATVFELEYEVADEAKNLTQLSWEMDGYKFATDQNGTKIPVLDETGQQRITDCSHVVGKRFRGKGVFLFEKGTESGRNKTYFDWLTNLGIETKQVGENGQLVHQLQIPEEEDVIGKPYLVRLYEESFITRDTKHLPKDKQEVRSIWKVKDAQFWAEGTMKSSAELDSDLPF